MVVHDALSAPHNLPSSGDSVPQSSALEAGFIREGAEPFAVCRVGRHRRRAGNMSSPLRRKLAKFGQTHVLRFVDALADAEREEFLQQLESLDFEAAVEAFNSATARPSEQLPPLVPLSDEDIFSLGDVVAVDAWRRSGLAAIARGGVAALVLAGGQGTRLRFSHPKGEYDDQLPSHASLFQVSGCCAQDALPPLAGLQGTSPSLACLSARCMWQIFAERIQRLKELAGGGPALPLLLMTSAATHDETAAFFADHDYFGLPPEDVILFRQGELPAYEADGKIVLETRSRVALVPDGNGGVFEALHRHGVLDTLAARGVEYVTVSSVDNIACRIADPVFVGLCASRGAAVGSKVVEKTDPAEAVGILAATPAGGHIAAVEYSELSPEAASARREDGRLVWQAGNLCAHCFAVGWLREVGRPGTARRLLRWHASRKPVAHVSADGVAMPLPRGEEAGSAPPDDGFRAVKLERLMFDAFAAVPRGESVVLAVRRDEEFAPLKNAAAPAPAPLLHPPSAAAPAGPAAVPDTPETARAFMTQLHTRWLEAAGATVLRAPAPPGGTRLAGGSNTVDAPATSVARNARVEVSPLVSYAGEGLEWVKGRTLRPPLLIVPRPLQLGAAATSSSAGAAQDRRVLALAGSGCTADPGGSGAAAAPEPAFKHAYHVSAGVHIYWRPAHPA